MLKRSIELIQRKAVAQLDPQHSHNTTLHYITLHHSFTCPHLSYSDFAWTSNYSFYLLPWAKLQKRISTYVLLCSHLDLPTHPLTYPPTYLPTHPPTCLSTYLPTYPPTYPPTIYLPTYLSTYLPTHLPTYPPTHLPTYLPTYPPTCLPTYRTTTTQILL